MNLINSPKVALFQKLVYFTKGLRINEMVSFMSGYINNELKLDLSAKATMQLHQCIMNMISLVSQNVISRENTISIIVEAAFKVKSYQNNYARLIKQFKNEIEGLINETAINDMYLKKKWSRDSHLEQQNQMNEQLIKQIMAEEEEKHKKQIQSKAKLQIECQICITEVDQKDLGSLECGHIFHRECIYAFIKSSIDSNKLDVKCPMEGCPIILSISDIRQFIDGPTLQKYEQFSFNKYVEMNSKDTSWCPTAGCSAVFSFDEALTNYRCNCCKKHYCLQCKAIYHDGMTCAQYRINNSYGEDDRKFEEFVRGAKYKQCPKCNFWVERVAGCSTMACRCGHQFCYDCGGSDCPHGACKNLGKAPIIPLPIPVVHPKPKGPKRR